MNLRRRALSLAAIAALSLALVPTPVLATAVGACVPGGGAVDTFLGRDGTAREKDTGQPHADLPPRAKGKAPSNFSVAVPVWFHVITDGSARQPDEPADHRPDGGPKRWLRWRRGR